MWVENLRNQNAHVTQLVIDLDLGPRSSHNSESGLSEVHGQPQAYVAAYRYYPTLVLHGSPDTISHCQANFEQETLID